MSTIFLSLLVILKVSAVYVSTAKTQWLYSFHLKGKVTNYELKMLISCVPAQHYSLISFTFLCEQHVQSRPIEVFQYVVRAQSEAGTAMQRQHSKIF